MEKCNPERVGEPDAPWRSPYRWRGIWLISNRFYGVGRDHRQGGAVDGSESRYPDGDDEWEEWIRGLLELGGGEGQDGDVG